MQKGITTIILSSRFKQRIVREIIENFSRHFNVFININSIFSNEDVYLEIFLQEDKILEKIQSTHFGFI